MKNAILDTNKPLSQSIIWQLQREFFHEEGINAWQNKVPFYVTSNTYFADQISKITRIYILEALLHGKIDPVHPIYIVELGVGSGQFSFRFLQNLSEYGHYLKNWDLDIRYIMTDFTKSNLDFWNTHEGFQPFLDSGQLDFAQFNADFPNDFVTQKNKYHFGSKTIHNPIVLITNYLYDSISCDVFRISNGSIEEGLLTVETHKNNLKNNKVIDLHKLTNSFTYNEITTEHYTDPRLNSMLEHYKTCMGDGVITIPTGAIRCIDFFRNATSNGVMNIASDKGFSDFHAFEGSKEMHVAFHSSFSIMVNFHALGLLTGHIDHAYIPGLNDSGLKTCLLYYDHVDHNFNETSLALNEGLNTYSSEDFLNIKNMVLQTNQALKLSDIISVLKLSHWDAKIFLSLESEFIEQLSNLSYANIQALRYGIPRLIKGFYEMPNQKFPHFNIARTLHYIQNYESAITHYKMSIANGTDTAASHYNIGLCEYCLHHYDEAKLHFETCKKISPNFNDVDQWIETVS